MHIVTWEDIFKYIYIYIIHMGDWVGVHIVVL